MLSSLIATVEGAVDLVTGVWDQRPKEKDEGNTAGVDIRHCKEPYKFLRSLGFEFGKELSTVEILKSSNTFYILSVVQVLNCPICTEVNQTRNLTYY